MKIKPILGLVLQFFGSILAFSISLIAPEFISPLSPEIMEAGKSASRQKADWRGVRLQRGGQRPGAGLGGAALQLQKAGAGWATPGAVFCVAGGSRKIV